jgi:diamine N-acetyltransferase
LVVGSSPTRPTFKLLILQVYLAILDPDRSRIVLMLSHLNMAEFSPPAIPLPAMRRFRIWQNSKSAPPGAVTAQTMVVEVVLMQGSIRIRRAAESDALSLSVLAENTFRTAFAESNSPQNMALHCAASYSQALQLAEIRDSRCETWVADTGQKLAAYVQLRLDAILPTISGERPIEIQRFYVDALHHGSGLAHHLMAHVLARAQAVGAAALWLGVWERNSRALAFYRKWRFSVIGEHIFKVGDDPQRDLLMCRSVESDEVTANGQS